jgi:acetoacetyl-CoA synthetase
MPRKLWEHPDPKSTQMYKFQVSLERKLNRKFQDYSDLYAYSTASRSDFWLHTFAYFPLVYTGAPPDPCIDESARMDSVPRWFEGVYMNFAQSILFSGDGKGRPTTQGKEDAKVAVTVVREGAVAADIEDLTWGELRGRVGWLANAMKARGLQKGDRVAVVASNSIDTLTVFLACTALGGLFSSSSTDMGVTGILDRLTQIRPRWVFIDDWSVYNGKTADLRPKMRAVVQGMKGVAEFEAVVVQPRFPARQHTDLSGMPRTTTKAQFLRAAPTSELAFEQVAFSDPFLIVYSSGTTGQPKCIVHSVGGIVLNGHKEGRLHRDIDDATVQLQYTTTGWIMYLASVQALLMGARMVLYDGSPFVPDLKRFVRLVGEQGVTHMGISPRYLQTLQTANVRPKEVADLSRLRVITSTGMVLSDALFEWVYDEAFPPRVHLDNISGGTDLAGCFGLGNPMLPVYVGGCQCLSLGTPVKVYDQTIESKQGVEVEDGVPGELVSFAAFPNMPVKFWGESGPKRYFDSYFARFDGVWTHGDFIMIHPVTKNVIFLGRADGVLNPSGVRFGSAEIYGIVDAKFGDRIADSICVGQRRSNDSDESVMLFLLMKQGVKFTKELVDEVKSAIRKETSPRHVPKYVFETPEIPVRC